MKVTIENFRRMCEISLAADTIVDEGSITIVDESGEEDVETTKHINELARVNKRKNELKELLKI